MLHLPFTFAKSKETHVKVRLHDDAAVKSKTLNIRSEAAMLYDSLKLNILGLSHEAYDYAIAGLGKLKLAGKIYNDQLISIVDFTKSSSQKRLFVIDLRNHRLLFNTYVAHGQNSGNEYANRFSNKPESFQSSLGFYQTSGTYNGKNGYSMQLNGLENGINNKADERAIVMHGAPYVSENYIRARGYLGRSWGCPAVPEKLNKPIIDRIKNGTCLFIYSENRNYLSHSSILNS
jgi:hypothetical protein